MFISVRRPTAPSTARCLQPDCPGSAIDPKQGLTPAPRAPRPRRLRGLRPRAAAAALRNGGSDPHSVRDSGGASVCTRAHTHDAARRGGDWAATLQERRGRLGCPLLVMATMLPRALVVVVLLLVLMVLLSLSLGFPPRAAPLLLAESMPTFPASAVGPRRCRPPGPPRARPLLPRKRCGRGPRRQQGESCVYTNLSPSSRRTIYGPTG